jgi:16S rRNA (cytosine1402-N4)-methyltransferase
MKASILSIEHYPVLWREVLAHLPKTTHFMLDGTLGHGGHAKLILEAHPEIETYFGLDRDPSVIQWFEKNPRPRLEVRQANFQRASEYMDLLGEQQLCCCLLDLGTSQNQLQDPSRGFSFLREGPLDMRMNPTEGISLLQWLMEASEAQITSVLFEYGEEKYSRKVAQAIVKNRGQFQSTTELAKIIADAIPWSSKRDSKIHPATRSFQGLRIYINEELSGLGQSLEQIMRRIRPGGRLLVISFHSLEDRIVKQKMRGWEEEIRSRSLFGPGEVVKESLGKCVPRSAIKPTDLEIQENSPSRSARLRVFVKGDA